MWADLITGFWIPILLAISLGPVSWWFGQFYGRQIEAFYSLRQQIRESLVRYANVAADADANRIEPIVGEYRELGVKLDSLWVGSIALVRWTIRRRGYDVPRAHKGLIGFSNEFRHYG